MWARSLATATCATWSQTMRTWDRGRTPNFTATLRQVGSNDLVDVIPLLLAPCGLDDELDIDTAELIPEGIQEDCSFAIAARQQVRTILEQLAQAYRFYVVESGEKLKFRQFESGDRFFDIPEADTDGPRTSRLAQASRSAASTTSPSPQSSTSAISTPSSTTSTIRSGPSAPSPSTPSTPPRACPSPWCSDLGDRQGRCLRDPV